MSSKSFQQFVNELRQQALNQPQEIAQERTKLLLQKYEDKLDEWICDDLFVIENESGFVANVLHEEDDHQLCIMATSWLPGKGAPPHNHATWAVVTGLHGEEVNTLWKIDGNFEDEPQVEINAARKVECHRGEYLELSPDDVHSVFNNGDEISVSLQIYGVHPNHTQRVQINPENGQVKPFVCAEKAVKC